MALNQRQRLVVTLVASGAVGLIAAFAAVKGVGKVLELPEDAQLADLSGAPVDQPAPRPGRDELPPPDDREPMADDAPREPDDREPGAREPQDREPQDREPDDRELADAPSGRARQDWVDPIVARNIFDSSKVGQAAQPGGGDVAEGGRRSDLKVVLLATLVAIPEEYSSALISEEKGPSSGYGVGDTLAGEATILRIEQKKVFLRRNDGTVEYIAMDEGKGRAEEPAKGDEESKDEGVTKSGDNKFIVDRSVVEQALENPEGLARQVRVSPHKGADGEIDGYRLSGIRRNSTLDKLQIKNGDIVHSVNGKELTSTSAALDAYNSMSSSSSFSFDITRRNKRQTMDYEIR